jgi:hypothetical protein
MQSEQINELSAALAKAQAEIKHAGKSADNPYFKSKYADLPAVLDAAKFALAANGLSVVQSTLINEAGGVVLVTQLNHSSGQWIRGFYPVNPIKSDPQGFGSAMTYARRYAYSAMVGVAADDDDDGNAASGNVTHQRQESAASRNKRFKAVSDAIQASDDPAFTWGEHKAAVDEFKATDAQFYDELVKLAKKRKDDLAALEMQKQQLGE